VRPYFEQLAANIRLADVFDVTVIAFLLYFVLSWLFQRAARTLCIGATILIGLFLCARWFDMYLTTMLLQTGFTAMLLTLIVVFQQDIRRELERMAVVGLFRYTRETPPGGDIVSILVESIVTLADNRTGALLVFARQESLDRHVRGGVAVDGRVSFPLLNSIFHPASPGHDGAVLITGDRIHKLGVHLPLSRNHSAIGRRGTRHAAALGLSERCDALVFAVSEERGTISVAEHEELREIASAELTARLKRYYQDRFEPETKRQQYRRVAHGIGLKVAALSMASILWLLFAYRMETIHRTFNLPIEYRNLPADWVIIEPRATRAELTLSGSERAFDVLDASSLRVSFDLSHIRSETPYLLRTASNLKDLPSDVKVNQIKPSEVTVTVRRKTPAGL
jgi:uncharacterized protein (TIGR00159 family)